MWKLILVSSITWVGLTQGAIAENLRHEIPEAEDRQQEILRILEDILNNEKFLRKLQQREQMPLPSPDAIGEISKIANQ